MFVHERGNIMKKSVYQLLDQYNGNLSWNQINDAGIARNTIYRMLKSGELEQVYRGLFIGSSDFEDTNFLLQQRFEKGILSHESALALHDLSNVLPEKVHFSFPQGYHLNKKVLEETPIDAHYVKAEYHLLGMIYVKSVLGNELRMYNKERTLCDVWNPWSRTLSEYKIEAVKNYMQMKDRDIPKLLKYMNYLPVDKELDSYIQALV